jgi:hypothetical protein
MAPAKARKKKVKHMINLKAKLHIGHKRVQVIVTLPGNILLPGAPGSRPLWNASTSKVGLLGR